MGDAEIEAGGGIRARARAEVRRQAGIRAGAVPVVAMFETLARTLQEADVPASFRQGGVAYRGRTLDCVLAVPRIHERDGEGIPEWPEECLVALGYEVSIDPANRYVDLAGPFELGPDGGIVHDPEDDRRDPEWNARYKLDGDAGLEPLARLVLRVQDLAVRREIVIQSRMSP